MSLAIYEIATNPKRDFQNEAKNKTSPTINKIPPTISPKKPDFNLIKMAGDNIKSIEITFNIGKWHIFKNGTKFLKSAPRPIFKQESIETASDWVSKLNVSSDINKLLFWYIIF